MIQSAVTLNLIDSMHQGPWIYWHELEASFKKASELGFDAVELFTQSGHQVDSDYILELLERYHLKIAAVGTGAGKVLQGLTLTDTNPEIRRSAIEYISEMIAFGAKFGAPAIIGSMQGNVSANRPREEAFAWLAEGLLELQNQAKAAGVLLIYEPLNRYESNLMNTLEAGSTFLKEHQLDGIRLLADLFHMNIEEENLAESLSSNAPFIGHVHFADSNRRPMGFGHTDMSPIAVTLHQIGYSGYVSAEAFPYPNSDEAATQTIREFKKYFR